MENLEYTYMDISKESVSQKALVICAINAINRTKGVHSLYGSISDSISENFLKKENYSKGLKIDVQRDGIVVNVNIVAEFGHKIPIIAWDLQENVKSEIEEITERKVKEVNVNIKRVEIGNGYEKK